MLVTSGLCRCLTRPGLPTTVFSFASATASATAMKLPRSVTLIQLSTPMLMASLTPTTHLGRAIRLGRTELMMRRAVFPVGGCTSRLAADRRGPRHRAVGVTHSTSARKQKSRFRYVTECGWRTNMNQANTEN